MGSISLNGDWWMLLTLFCNNANHTDSQPHTYFALNFYPWTLKENHVLGLGNWNDSILYLIRKSRHFMIKKWKFHPSVLCSHLRKPSSNICTVEEMRSETLSVLSKTSYFLHIFGLLDFPLPFQKETSTTK
jgi:hypothetical protein